jgi:orotidine-5'-phosphate decarboxylase
MRALLQLKREEIIALPIHDCVVVRADHAERARVVMEEAFQLVMPGAKATADVDYG